MKYRPPDGRQVQKKIGPAWTERGRPAAGYFTKRQAEDALRELLHEARRGTLPGMTRSGATFADAAAEYLRYCEHDRACKPSTLRDYRSNLDAHLLPAFGAQSLEIITPDAIDAWRNSLTGLSSRTKNKLLVVMGGVMRRAQHVWGLPSNPVASVEKHRAPLERRHRCLLPRGGDGPRPRRSLRAGRGDLPRCGVHRPASRRAVGAALARCRLHRFGRPRPHKLRRRAADDAQVG
jgi:hypothetical protein